MNDEQKKRFYSKIDIPWDNMIFGCWEWNGSTTRGIGYGQFSLNNNTYSAHRISYLLWYGKYPDNFACHTCDNHSCVNPLHLWDGTPKQNSVDMMNKNRGNKGFGSNHSQAKLTEEQVLDIRRREIKCKEDGDLIAKEFNIKRKTVHKIKRREIWKHI